MTRPWQRVGSVVAVAAAVSGCELSEVTIPVGEPVVVVQAVMRPDLSQQFVVVERSFTGAIDPTTETGSIPLGGFPQTPIEGAMVRVTNLDFPGDPCGSPVVFASEPENPVLHALAGVYWAPLSCPTMRPGDRLALRVETPEGEVVAGVTRIPGLDAAWLAVADDSVAFDAGVATTFNRDRDTLRVRMETLAGRLMQLEVRRLDHFGAPDMGAFSLAKIFADTTALLLPGDVLNVFERGEGDEVFRAGRHYAMTVAVTDTNYFDFARSGNNAFTGRGFINRLTGGIGVFGSLAAAVTPVTAAGDLDDPREGVYRLQGQLAGIDVDAELTVYLTRSLEETELSAFLDGDWVKQGEDIWFPWQPTPALSIDGTFVRDTLSLLIVQPGAGGLRGREGTSRLLVEGVRLPGAQFTVTVEQIRGIGPLPFGTLSVTQQ